MTVTSGGYELMKYDVIIAGAGPAGAMAALECARSGLSVLIIEKEHLPRSKTCAGGVTAAAVNLLGCRIPDEIIEARCSTFLGYYGTKSIRINTEKEFMFVVSRDKFDFWLVKMALQAGAALREGEKVTSFDINSDGVTVKTQFSGYAGRLLIGADGVNSTIAKAIRGPFRKTDLALCLCADCDIPDHRNFNRGQIEIHYGPLPMSYSWLFPKNDSISCGMGGWFSEASALKSALYGFMEKRGIKKQPVRGHGIPLGGISRVTVGDRVLLAGDAAGYADPFTGEGIRYAIASGRLAAKAVSYLIMKGMDLKKQNFAIYEKSCYRAFGADLRAAMAIARIFQNRPDILFGLYFNSHEPFKKSLEILQGRIGYQNYFRWFIPHIPLMLLRRSAPAVTRA